MTKEITFGCKNCDCATALLEKIQMDRDTLQIDLLLVCPRCAHFARVSMQNLIWEVYKDEDA